jgi:hypothetical protein
LPARNYSGVSMADGDNIIRLAELQDSGKDINTTEDGMALMFAERHAGHLRYVAVWSRWLSYDGTLLGLR